MAHDRLEEGGRDRGWGQVLADLFSRAPAARPDNPVTA